MRYPTLIACSTVAALAFAGSPAVAQDRAGAQRQAEESAGRETRRAAEASAQASEEARRASVQEELDRARDEMEQAAAEVARLSAEYAGPIVKDVTKRFHFAGQRAMLGLNVADTDQGARVNGVSPNGPAAEAGLEVGDVITSIDGASLVGGAAGQSPSEVLLAQMRNVDVGKQIALGIVRDGKPQAVTITTRELEPGQFFGLPRGNCAGRAGDDSCFSLSLPGPNTWQRFFVGYDPWRRMQLVTLTPELGTYFATQSGLLVVRAPNDASLGLARRRRDPRDRRPGPELTRACAQDSRELRSWGDTRDDDHAQAASRDARYHDAGRSRREGLESRSDESERLQLRAACGADRAGAAHRARREPLARARRRDGCGDGPAFRGSVRARPTRRSHGLQRHARLARPPVRPQADGRARRNTARSCPRLATCARATACEPRAASRGPDRAARRCARTRRGASRCVLRAHVQHGSRGAARGPRRSAAAALHRARTPTRATASGIRPFSPDRQARSRRRRRVCTSTSRCSTLSSVAASSLRF